MDGLAVVIVIGLGAGGKASEGVHHRGHRGSQGRATTESSLPQGCAGGKASEGFHHRGHRGLQGSATSESSLPQGRAGGMATVHRVPAPVECDLVAEAGWGEWGHGALRLLGVRFILDQIYFGSTLGVFSVSTDFSNSSSASLSRCSPFRLVNRWLASWTFCSAP